MRAAIELDLPLPLDRASGATLQRQLADALRAAALDGRLGAGSRLPSTRRLASQLSLARATVVAAYEQLTGEGYLEAGHGSGTFVNTCSLPEHRPRPAAPSAPTIEDDSDVLDLRPGRPDTHRLVDPAWRAAWRAAAAGPVPSTEPPVQGLPALRDQVAEHLRVARGVDADPDGVFVAAGTAEALALAVHALDLRGTTVAVEDPGYPSARRVLRRLGCHLRAVPVDDDGLRVDDLDAAGHPPGAVLLTPSHQYPLGAVLPLERRLALLDHARRRGTVVIEDDYDSEFRYGAAPMPALASLDPALVVHVGTFSKTITPWLRAGFLLVPEQHRPAFRAARADLGCPVSGVEQQALATYLASGALRRHVARSRRDHAHRRAHLLGLLAERPDLTSTDTRAGLHAVVRLPAGTDVAALLARLIGRGVRLADLAEYAVDAAGVQRLGPAVVLGFGAATTGELDLAVRAVHDLLLGGRRGARPAPVSGGRRVHLCDHRHDRAIFGRGAQGLVSSTTGTLELATM